MSKRKDPNIHNKDTDNEIVYEKDSVESGFSDCETKLKKIKEELKNCQKEKQEYLDGWQRAKADLINYKKRAEEEKKDFVKYANENFILEILPVLDNFEHAFKNKEAWEKIDKNWTTGIEFIYNQLKKALEENNVFDINPLGQDFNPQTHHSIEIVEIDNKENDGKIIDVTQRGYKIGERIIRHANVRVGKYKNNADS